MIRHTSFPSTVVGDRSWSRDEFMLKGYDIHYVTVDKVYGRGVILYTASWLNASPYTTSDSCLESLWVTVRLSGKDRLIIGCIYRSPSSSAENNEKINNQIRSVCTSGDASHIYFHAINER